MLTIDGAEANNFTTAAVALSARVTPPAQDGKATMKLLKTITNTAIENRARTYTEASVDYAYCALIAMARERQAQQEEARVACRDIMTRQDNKANIAKLGNLMRQQDKQLAQLENAAHIVITRGTDPVQALGIFNNQTFGGVRPGPVQTGAPASGDADRQTGYGIKETADGRIEEWSLGSLAGFATGGFLVRAVTTPSLVTLPPSGARSGAESGVCGFADRSLLGVVIVDEGKEPIADPFEREIENVLKANTRAGTVSATLQASPQ